MLAAGLRRVACVVRGVEASAGTRDESESEKDTHKVGEIVTLEFDTITGGRVKHTCRAYYEVSEL